MAPYKLSAPLHERRPTGDLPPEKPSIVCRRAQPSQLGWRKPEEGRYSGAIEPEPDRTPPLVVLDTNVVLDWLFFQDLRCHALETAITADHVRWVATSAMRAEIDHVLERGLRGVWPGTAATVDGAWSRWATLVECTHAALGRSMRCTDPDDQKFIDLALQVGAATLLSADRAVLRLARTAKAYGLQIMTVDAWSKTPP